MNKKFKVEITEILQKFIEVEAPNELEALNKVRKMYFNEEVILDASSYIDTKIEIVTE